MRRLALAIALVGVLAIAGSATAAKFRTFGDGAISVNGGTVTLDNAAGQFSGVYLNPNMSGRPLRSIHMSFVSTGGTTGGAPRFSIPLNTGHVENTTPYAFLDVNNCGGTPNTATTVSTDRANCKVFLNFAPYESFANWKALVLAHPTWRLPKGGIPFIIADEPGHYVVSQIHLR